MLDFTFLTEEQIFGSDKQEQLEIFKKRGVIAPISDFAILCGGYVNDNYHYNNNNKSLENRSGWYWTKTPHFDNACVVDHYGNSYSYNVYLRDGGSRPALMFSSIQKISKNVVNGNDGIKEVEFGEYPQMVAPADVQNILEGSYKLGILNIVGKNYTIDSRNYNDYDNGFKPEILFTYEYELNFKKYVRVIANSCYGGQEFILSNGKKYKDGDYVWVEVQPIKWLVDEKYDIAISERLLFAGVQFNKKQNYTGNFENTDIKKYMDNCFSQEIIPRGIKIDNNATNQNIRKQNPYDFSFDKVSEEDIIKGAIQSKVSVFLHGRSSEGKSARVKQLDPNAEIIYLRNATPDSLNGKSVYNSETGEMIDIPPTWYKKVLKKCEEEPDKIHIIFFDEITNALPSIQGIAFNIVLDGEVNGIWKLPDNARIVAAGNDLNDSLAANRMAEPLFNRFAHVYINTTVDSWLKWASTPKEQYERLDYNEDSFESKIHPAIYAYIAYKSYGGIDVLRTPYNGETPNADPRKWEMASKVLYKTKNPEMLRALIGEALTTDFTTFCMQSVITVEDVINGNYTEKEIEMNLAEKYATAVGLSHVDEDNLIVVREFISKLGKEVLTTFDTLWSHGDESRLEKLAEIKLSEGGMKK